MLHFCFFTKDAQISVIIGSKIHMATSRSDRSTNELNHISLEEGVDARILILRVFALNENKLHPEDVNDWQLKREWRVKGSFF